MSYLLNEENQILKDQLQSLLSEHSSSEILREVSESGLGWSESLWNAVVEMGLPAVAIPEEYGGLGLGPIETGVILEELGRVVAPVPYLSHLLATDFLLLAGSAEQKSIWLPRMASGEVVGTVAWTEGSMTPGASQVACAYEAGLLTGSKLPVADGRVADFCIVVAKEGDQVVLALTELSQSSVTVRDLDSIDELRSMAELVFEGAEASRLPTDDAETVIEHLLDRAAVYMSFEQVGGCEAALLMARDYSLERYIFGRQLASFQAVKHKLAEIFRQWDLARCNTLAAAAAMKEERPDLRAVAATARVSTVRVYDHAARENLHLHGGIGFTLESDCHFHYRRARLLALQLGSGEFWANRLVLELEKPAEEKVRGRSKKTHSPDEAAPLSEYRKDVRTWIESTQMQLEVEDLDSSARTKFWLQAKHNAGFAAIGQPSEFGGSEGTREQARIFAEEEARAGLRMIPGAGYQQAMAAIRSHGTPEQRQKWEMLTNAGQAIWCQLFSEPAAGSDLAAVRTRAVKEGDRWVVNGQKVWTSGGTDADYGILLARTDVDVPKHAGLSFFIINMRQSGVTVRPIRQINGQSHFTETFLDNAIVDDDDRLGALGEGWSVAMTVLAAERNTAERTEGGSAGGSRQSRTSSRSLIDLAKSLPRNEGTAFDSLAVREKIAHFHMEAQGIKSFSQRLVAYLKTKGSAPTNIPVMKLTTTNRLQQIEAFMMDLQESGGVVVLPGEEKGKFFNYLTSASIRIAGGADEVLLNQLAERALGMPGEVRSDKDVPFSELPY